jgi:predicted branched-subunit amino acid permease
MILRKELRQHPEFLVGMRESLPQLPGLAAWGLMTGVAMVKAGLPLSSALLMTLLVYAGSAQLAVLPLLLAGAPAWVILATGFCVNLRFVVFSLHLRGYLMHLPRLQRLFIGYLCTDMTYAQLIRRHPHTAADDPGQRAREAYLAGSCSLYWISWMAPSLGGVALANFIPTEWGLGFAGLLCLVGILCSLASTRLRVVSMAVAGTVGVAAYALPLKLNIVLAIASAVLACMLLEQRLSRGARA